MDISGDIVNNSDNTLFPTKAGKLIFNGTGQQYISGTTVIKCFQADINKPSGNIVLQQNVIINDSLRLLKGSIDLNSKNIDLLGTGYLALENNQNRVFGNSGTIKAVRLFQHPVLSENIAGLGLYISSKDNFDTTYFERGHTMQTFTGDSSIFRYYNFTPSSVGHIDTLKLSYLDNSETVLNEFLYKVFASQDNGIDWKNKGGVVDTNRNFVLSTTVSPPDIGPIRFSVFPTENFATCLPNDSNYISAIFLVSSTANERDSVKFVQLSAPVPQSYNWNFGDGITTTDASPYHVYDLPDTIASFYAVTMTVSNGVCSDTRKKTIQINPAMNTLRNMTSYQGINSVQLFPNPNSGLFNVEVSTFDIADITIDVMDPTGNTLSKMAVRSDSFKQQLNIDELSPGLYFLRVQAGNEQRIVKLVKL
jgi:hypothetical protein